MQVIDFIQIAWGLLWFVCLL